MENITFKFLSLQENLLASVLKNESCDNTLYIFPTESSKRQAIRIFQKQWHLQEMLFLSMEELKNQLFVARQPLLKEEKRTLAFYRALDAQDKQFFHIHNYFQAVELAHNFFALWEEFNEELVDENLNLDLFMQEDAPLLDWQQKTWQQLVKIKTQYERLLDELGFTDTIFTFNEQTLSLQLFSNVKNIVLVNQFYYTALEKFIIQAFQQQNKAVTVYYQLEPELVNTQDFSIRPFHVRDLGPFNNRQLCITECTGEFAMLTELIQLVHTGSVRHVIDTSFLRMGYASFLSPEKFNVNGTGLFYKSSVVRFFDALFQLSAELVFEPNRKKILLPLDSLLAAFADDVFCQFIIADDSEITREQTRHLLYKCIDDDFKFVDLDGDFFLTVCRDDAAVHVQQAMKLLLQLKSIQNLSDFVNWIDRDNGIDMQRVIAPAEDEIGNIRESFYRALADFAAIEKINLVADWSDFFASRDATGFAVANGILRLFLEYLKPKTFRLTHKTSDNPRIDFITLQDSRNLAYKSVAVMDVIEGKLPHPRTPLFLFTEKQRKLMGLKSYEDIKLREKYYFMRLVLCTPKVTLFTRKNINDNIDVSSFVEELRIALPAEQVKTQQVPHEHLQGVYPYFLQNASDYIAPSDLPSDLSFYQIPFEKNTDFPKNELRLSYYRFKNLHEFPFHYFIANVANLNEYSFATAHDFSSRLIGQITHECLNAVWKSLLEAHFLPPYEIDFSQIDEQLLHSAVDKVLKKHSLYYQFPHNHTDIYFQHILLPRLKEGMHAFFEYLHLNHLSSTDLHIYPEKDDDDLRADYQQLLSEKENDIAVRVCITGRTDLRMEASDDSCFWIVDYKAGSFQKEQLLIYELYYYLLEKPFLQDRVHSFFYNILDKKAKQLSDYKVNRKNAANKNEYIEPFKQEIMRMLNDLPYNGFGPAQSQSKMKYMQDIVRTDLYRNRLGK